MPQGIIAVLPAVGSLIDGLLTAQSIPAALIIVRLTSSKGLHQTTTQESNCNMPPVKHASSHWQSISVIHSLSPFFGSSFKPSDHLTQALRNWYPA